MTRKEIQVVDRYFKKYNWFVTRAKCISLDLSFLDYKPADLTEELNECIHRAKQINNLIDISTQPEILKLTYIDGMRAIDVAAELDIPLRNYYRWRDRALVYAGSLLGDVPSLRQYQKGNIKRTG